MPKPARKAEVVQETKDKILDEALNIILEEGFNDFSMRKLASRVGMTAANIYNYYTNKDELYLGIQTEGFALLYELFLKAYRSFGNPVLRLKAMMEVYIKFGTENANYYDIMFNRNTPKYADYVGTSIEPVARFEKETALKVADITSRVIKEIAGLNKRIKEKDAEHLTLKLWTALHGIVTLYNSRVLQEVSEDTRGFMDRMVDELISPFRDETL
ncbi:MAG: TetR/AcrR family transcriptional regulator [Deltaproteobacteria bacterium]|nr:TetR/AcrR family transcriptional regulator [Deltaproteobacteria bacterium]